MSTFADSDVGFESAAQISVLVLGHAVGDGVVADVTGVLAVSNFLHQVVLTCTVNVVVALNLIGEGLARNGFKLESLDELVFGGVALTGDLNLADVGTTVKFADDERVAGDSGVVGVVVVLTVVCGFKVVATVEEFRYVSATSAFDDELATRVVRGVVSAVEDEIVEEEKVALTFAGNSVELFFGDDGKGSHKLDVLSHELLVTNLKDNHRHDKEDR